MVGKMLRLIGAVNIERLGHDAGILTGEFLETAQHPLRPAGIGEQAEIVAHHQDRIENTKRSVYLVESQLARIGHAPFAADFECARRYIYANDLVILFLQIQGKAPGAQPHIQYAPAHKLHRLLHAGRPFAEGCKIGIQIVGGNQITVITLNKLTTGLAGEMVGQQQTEGIVSLRILHPPNSR